MFNRVESISVSVFLFDSASLRLQSIPHQPLQPPSSPNPHSSLGFFPLSVSYLVASALWRRCATCSPHTLLFLRNERGSRQGGGGVGGGGGGGGMVECRRRVGFLGWVCVFFGMGVNEDEESNSLLALSPSPPLPIVSRWTIWMKMRSTSSDRHRTDNPVDAFGRSTRRGRGRQSSTQWIRTPPGSRP